MKAILSNSFILLLKISMCIGQDFSMTNFTNTDRVNSICQTDSSLLLATDGGIAEYHIVKDSMYTILTTANGLTDNEVNCIVPSKAGLWIGTNDGLSYYDGQTSINYTKDNGLASNEIKDLMVSKDDKIWVATVNGISVFDGEIWSTYTTDDGLAHNLCRCLIELPDSSIWVGSDNGISIFKYNQWDAFPYNDSLLHNWIYSMAVDSSYNIWVGTRFGLNKITPDTNIVGYTKSDGLIDDWVTSIAVDLANNIWCGTWYGASQHKEGSWFNFDTTQGLISNTVTDVFVDDKSQIWAGTPLGLAKLENEVWKNIDNVNEIPSNRCEDIYIDNDLIWVSSNSGASVLKQGTWSDKYKGYDLPDYPVKSILRSKDGTLWFGADQREITADTFNIESFDGTGFEKYDIVSSEINTMQADLEGNIWFGTPNGLFLNNGAGFETKYHYSQEYIRDIAFDDKGNIYLANNSGLDIYNGQTIHNFNMDDGLADDIIKSIAIDAIGNIWCGTGRGPSYYNSTTWVTFETFEIGNKSINDIEIDQKGNIWMATPSGIYIKHQHGWSSIERKDGLADNIVRDINIENDSLAWVATYNGVSAIKYTIPGHNIPNSTMTWNLSQKITLNPIPADDYIFVEIQDKSSSHNRIQLVDLLGKIIYSKSFTTNTYRLNTSHLQDGIYFIHINNNNMAHHSQKIMIKHK